MGGPPSRPACQSGPSFCTSPSTFDRLTLPLWPKRVAGISTAGVAMYAVSTALRHWARRRQSMEASRRPRKR